MGVKLTRANWLPVGKDLDRWFMAHKGGRPLPPDILCHDAVWWLIPYCAVAFTPHRVGPFSTKELAQAAAEAMFEMKMDLFEEHV